ncbi:hypothetical protein EMIT0111MI5_100245 [Burkholderia sp. IT-111MI5]
MPRHHRRHSGFLYRLVARSSTAIHQTLRHLCPIDLGGVRYSRCRTERRSVCCRAQAKRTLKAQRLSRPIPLTFRRLANMLSSGEWKLERYGKGKGNRSLS